MWHLPCCVEWDPFLRPAPCGYATWGRVYGLKLCVPCLCKIAMP